MTFLGLNTSADTARRTFPLGRQIGIGIAGGLELRFPVAENSRLAHGSPTRRDPIERSPLGLPRPDFEKDLSFRDLPEGDFRQHQQRQN